MRHAIPWLALLLSAGLAKPLIAQDDAFQKRIQLAIDHGAKHLKSLQDKSGTWKHPGFETGMTALAAWTLLEARVPAGDPAIKKSASELRKQCPELKNTYGASLAIIFFDRLGDTRDRPLIQALATRLLAGQNQHGGWSYECATSPEQEKALQSHLQNTGKARDDPFPEEARPGAKQVLPVGIQQLVEGIGRQTKAAEFGDNSNTQFAMLALWVARRHGMPVDPALALVDERFRRAQFPQGAWGYNHILYKPRPTMSCAGLLGLALGRGIKPKEADIRSDPKVERGLKYLGTLFKDNSPRSSLESAGLYYYFLFSLERMAVIYDLKTIGGKDWYISGAKVLLENQQKDGSWMGDHGPADTCFALLFLRRANVAPDLTFDLNPIRKTKK